MYSESLELEEIFKRELLKRYDEYKKYLIPKDEYYKIIDSVKSASANSHTKSRTDYYLISK